MASIHLPNAVDAVDDQPSINRQFPPTAEKYQFRPARKPMMDVADTSQVRLQLERIATLLDEGFKKSANTKKVMESFGQKPNSGHLKRMGTMLQEPAKTLPFLERGFTELPNEPPRLKQVLGGTPITLELATDLRRLVYGSSIHTYSKEFRRSGFLFKTNDTPFQYGLCTDKTGSRGIILCVQAYIIRHLVYKYKTKEEIYRRQVLKPTTFEKSQALVRSLSQILWNAGDKKRCCVCLPQDKLCFVPTQHYRPDGITEKLHLFEFHSYKDTEDFVKHYLSYFEYKTGFGCILFLYSAILSRTLPKVLQDSGVDSVTGVQLLSDYEECRQPLINLLLAGRATKNLHNDTIMYNEEGELMDKPLVGIPERGDVGFLFWDRDENDRARTQVGSMLRTPRFPIWLTYINGNFGLLFSTNPDLVGDWRVEHRFQLHYYTGLATQSQAAVLSIDTRFGRKVRAKTAKSKKREVGRIPPVEHCIMTKWYGAEIDWNGVMPFV